VVDDDGLPVRLILTAGPAHDLRTPPQLRGPPQMPPRRPLRRRRPDRSDPRRRGHASHSVDQPTARPPLGQSPDLSPTQPRRTILLQARALPARRHSVRQARTQLLGSRRSGFGSPMHARPMSPLPSVGSFDCFVASVSPVHRRLHPGRDKRSDLHNVPGLEHEIHSRIEPGSCSAFSTDHGQGWLRSLFSAEASDLTRSSCQSPLRRWKSDRQFQQRPVYIPQLRHHTALIVVMQLRHLEPQVTNRELGPKHLGL